MGVSILCDVDTRRIEKTTRFNLGFKLVLNSNWGKIAGGSSENTIGFWVIEPNLIPATLSQEVAIRIPGHDYPGGIENLVWNPSGTRFATSAEDGTVRIWTITASNTLQQSQHFGVDPDEGIYAWATDLAWSPDGNRIAASTSDGTVKIWDTNNGNLLQILPHGPERVLSVTWSPDGSRIISDYTDLYVWDAVSYTLITTWANQAETLVMAWDSSHNLLALGNADGTIQIRNANDGKIIANFQAHPSLITSLVWSHDGSMLASGGQDSVAKIWARSSASR